MQAAYSREPNMSITMHSASVPVFVRLLNNLDQWLTQAEAHAQSRKFDGVNFLGSRLAVDMLPFTKQIQIACDAAKFGVARLADVEAPKFDDIEVSIAELRERIRKTVAFVQSVPAAQVDGTEEKDVIVPRRDGEITLKGEFYLKHFVLPNIYFHLTIAYALLRQDGVALVKGDFLGAMTA